MMIDLILLFMSAFPLAHMSAIFSSKFGTVKNDSKIVYQIVIENASRNKVGN
jgi:hypothetical protein